MRVAPRTARAARIDTTTTGTTPLHAPSRDLAPITRAGWNVISVGSTTGTPSMPSGGMVEYERWTGGIRPGLSATWIGSPSGIVGYACTTPGATSASATAQIEPISDSDFPGLCTAPPSVGWFPSTVRGTGRAPVEDGWSGIAERCYGRPVVGRETC